MRSVDSEGRGERSVLDVAVQAARKGGACIRSAWDRAHRISFKDSMELVTDTDVEAQRLIVSEIERAFPTHSILAEEEALRVDRDADRWIVDPLDGSVNFAHRFPFVGVSIAYGKGDDIRVGVVYNPILEELFWAEQGKGAYRNGEKIQVSRQEDLAKSLVATGFPYDIQSLHQEVMSRFHAMLLTALGVRRPGSAALDLAYVAFGVFDGFWEQALRPWDIAAGMLLVREAGGRVSDFRGNPVDLFKGEIVASNGRIHGRMIETLHSKGGRN